MIINPEDPQDILEGLIDNTDSHKYSSGELINRAVMTADLNRAAMNAELFDIIFSIESPLKEWISKRSSYFGEDSAFQMVALGLHSLIIEILNCPQQGLEVIKDSLDSMTRAVKNFESMEDESD